LGYPDAIAFPIEARSPETVFRPVSGLIRQYYCTTTLFRAGGIEESRIYAKFMAAETLSRLYRKCELVPPVRSHISINDVSLQRGVQVRLPVVSSVFTDHDVDVSFLLGTERQ
jgi:hypothetical protein